jgi:putative two-component system response regulator
VSGHCRGRALTIKKILVVDDDELNLSFMVSMLDAQGYVVETAVNGRQGIDKTLTFKPDVLLLDIMMPDMDGFSVLRELKVREETQQVPVILVTALDDRESRIRGFRAGAAEFVTKPVDRIELTLRLQNLIKVKEYGDFLSGYNKTLEAMVQQRTGQLETAFQELEEANRKIKSAYIDTIYRLTMAAEYKDELTANHLKRMSFYSRRLGEELGLDDTFIETIFYAAPMHDIGKIGIPDAILLKPGRLTAEEFELTKTHTTIGAKILAGSESLVLQMGERIAQCHHERWDGSGYPGGLRGADIPMEARIMTIVDQYDAMRSKRPYKPDFPHEKTMAIITEGDGRTMPSHFDPKVLRAFVGIEPEIQAIFEDHAD